MFPQISPLMQAKEFYFAFACLKKYPIFSVCDALSNALFLFTRTPFSVYNSLDFIIHFHALKLYFFLELVNALVNVNT